MVHWVVRQVTQGLCSAPRLAHQPASQVRAARPQVIDVRHVAVRGELAAQVQSEDVAKVVGEDVVVSELRELDVERQIARDQVDVGVRPVGVGPQVLGEDDAVRRLVLGDDVRELAEGCAEERDQTRRLEGSRATCATRGTRAVRAAVPLLALLLVEQRGGDARAKKPREAIAPQVVEDHVGRGLHVLFGGQLRVFVEDEPVDQEG